MFSPVGCAVWRLLSAGRSLHWQDTSNLRAQGFLPCQILTETELPPSLLHPSHIGRDTVLFCCPVNSSHTRSQSSVNYPKSEDYPILCPSWMRKDLSASWQVFSSIPPGSFLLKFNFLPRKWRLWGFYRIRISTFITGNYLKKLQKKLNYRKLTFLGGEDSQRRCWEQGYEPENRTL